tara:strand:- start:2402 stop:2566 length:165 start_codon:yes stop_codon:yes gene_type:complete
MTEKPLIERLNEKILECHELATAYFEEEGEWGPWSILAVAKMEMRSLIQKNENR